jgi:hypothetical protein
MRREEAEPQVADVYEPPKIMHPTRCTNLAAKIGNVERCLILMPM